MLSPVAGWWVGGVLHSLSGAYLQDYASYGYEILWVGRSHQGGVQCTGTITLACLIFELLPFLAHLSTTCSGGAIVTGHHPVSVRPSVRPLTISLKIFSSKTRRPILIKLGRNVPWVKLYKNCKKNLIPTKTLVAMATKWLKMEKIFKNLLVTNHKAGSIHNLYEASLGDPLPKLLKLFPWGHIWALPGHTLFYIETKKESFKKSSSDKP